MPALGTFGGVRSAGEGNFALRNAGGGAATRGLNKTDPGHWRFPVRMKRPRADPCRPLWRFAAWPGCSAMRMVSGGAELEIGRGAELAVV